MLAMFILVFFVFWFATKLMTTNKIMAMTAM